MPQFSASDLQEYMAWFEARGISIDYINRDKKWRVTFYTSRSDKTGWTRSTRFSDLLVDALRLGWADAMANNDWPMTPNLKYNEVPR